MNAKIEISRDAIAAFCQRNRIRRIAFFGSVLRDDFGPESDVDVLVEFEPGRTPGFAFIDMQDELSAILGRDADLHTFNAIESKQNGLLRAEILGSAEMLYERGPGYESWPQEGKPLETGGKRRDDRVSLMDMLIYARKAVDSFGEMSRADLEGDWIRELALTRAVEVIGEAANRVSPPTRERHPEIPWRQIIGARNLLAHAYDAVDLDTLCDIVQNHLPPLIRPLEAIVEEGT